MIIPLLAELDPANTSQLLRNWDMSACLKWRYAERLRLRKVFMSELSVASGQVPVLDAAIVASTVAAATEVSAALPRASCSLAPSCCCCCCCCCCRRRSNRSVLVVQYAPIVDS